MMTDLPYSLLAELGRVPGTGKPPVHLWHPDNVKDIDLVIKRDGTWLYQGTPIKRPRLVRLFASVLRLEGDEYFLVTPVEKCRITVEDAPFQAVLMEVIAASKAKAAIAEQGSEKDANGRKDAGNQADVSTEIDASGEKDAGNQADVSTEIDASGEKDASNQADASSEIGEGSSLLFTTDMGEQLVADADHALRIVQSGDEWIPYLHVRDGLEARLCRNVYYQLADLLKPWQDPATGDTWLGVWSGGRHFPLMQVAS